jgi:hypothetical protein
VSITKYFIPVLPDNDTLVLRVPLHVVVSVVRYSEYVRRQFTDLFVTIQLNLFGGVDGKDLVWIDCHQNGPSVRLQNTNMCNRLLNAYICALNLKNMD